MELKHDTFAYKGKIYEIVQDGKLELAHFFVEHSNETGTITNKIAMVKLVGLDKMNYRKLEGNRLGIVLNEPGKVEKDKLLIAEMDFVPMWIKSATQKFTFSAKPIQSICYQANKLVIVMREGGMNSFGFDTIEAKIRRNT